jgi:hypothetical protein
VSLRIQTLQKRLEEILALLSLWQQYVHIIYMPEPEAAILDSMLKSDMRPEEIEYA